MEAPLTAAASIEVDAPVCEWSGNGVKVDAVAAKMLELRHSASDDEGYPLARASVMNLIVFAAEPAHIGAAERIVEELEVKHPARAIVVSVLPGKAFSLDADLTLHRHPLAAHGLVYERAVLRAHGASREDLDTLVIPLLIPHLQSFLWWLGDPVVGDTGLRSLGAICDRLVIDSSLGPADRLRDLSVLIGGSATSGSSPLGRLVLGDVAWSRLDGFRRTLVQVFDEAHRAEYLDGVNTIDIVGRRGLRTPVSASEILFAGWLASRLGWTMPAWTRNGVSLRHGSGRVALAFSGVKAARPAQDAPPLQGVLLEAELGRRRLTVTLTASRGEGHLTVTETGAGTMRRTIPLPHIGETEAVSRELARLGRDRVYEDAMVSSARILAALEA